MVFVGEGKRLKTQKRSRRSFGAVCKSGKHIARPIRGQVVIDTKRRTSWDET